MLALLVTAGRSLPDYGTLCARLGARLNQASQYDDSALCLMAADDAEALTQLLLQSPLPAGRNRLHHVVEKLSIFLLAAGQSQLDKRLFAYTLVWHLLTGLLLTVVPAELAVRV